MMENKDRFRLGDAMASGDIVFLRADGTPADQNSVVANCDSEGNMHFLEIVGGSGIDGIPNLQLGGKNKYKRVMVRHVYPYGLADAENTVGTVCGI